MKTRKYPDEFWSLLLEKAYAKLYGSYNNLEGGTPSEALTDLTGGITQKLHVKTYCKRVRGLSTLLEYMKQSLDHYCMMACSISPKDTSFVAEEILKNGLVVGHSYCILRMDKVSWINLKDNLIRLRNPWGNTVKWNGPWSSKDRRWELVEDDMKNRLSLGSQVDGEFWMSYTDWTSNFDVLEVCHLSPSTVSRENLYIDEPLCAKEWNCAMFYGSWKRNISAGGRCDKKCDHGCNYWANPKIPIFVGQ